MNRLCWAIAIMLLLTHAVLVWQSRIPAVTPSSNDDALYLLLGRSLRSFRYLDQHILGAPIHAQYPPVYPGLIAGATAIFGDHLDVALGVTLLCSLLTLLLLYDMARRLASPPVAVLVLASVAFNSHLLRYGGRVASEMPYLAFSFAALWALIAIPGTRRPLLWAGGLAILAALTRSVGVSLVGAVLLLWLLQRRFRAAGMFAAAAALTVGLWFYWTAVAPNQISERSYAAVATKNARRLQQSPGLLQVRTARFVKTYVSGALIAGLEMPTVAGTAIDNVFWIVTILALAATGLWVLRKRAPLIPAYLICYLALLWIYPYKLTRFFMPIAPLVVLCMFLGVLALGRRFKPGIVLGIMLLLTIAMLADSLPRSLRMVRDLKDCERSQATRSPACFGPDRLAFFAATRFANQALPRDAVVLTIKEATFAFYTGLRVNHPDLAISRGRPDVTAYLERKGIRYVLLNAFVGGFEISPFLAPACGRIEVLGVYQPRTALLQIHPAGTTIPEARQACVILQKWAPPAGELDDQDFN